MFFNSMDKDYFVLTTVTSSKDYSTYICKKSSSASKQLYLINEYKNRKIIDSYLPLLIKLHEQKKFHPLTQLFVKDSKIYLIFKYEKPTLLSTLLLENKFTLDEKIKIANNFIIKLFEINTLPISIQYTILDLENINLDSNNEIYFNYFLNFVQTSDHILQSHVTNKIAVILSSIFEKETHLPLNIKTFMDHIYKNKFQSLSEIYAAFKEVQETLLTNQQIEEKESFFTKILNHKYRLIVSMIIVAAICFYLWEYKSVSTSTEPKTNKIGTVQLN